MKWHLKCCNPRVISRFPSLKNSIQRLNTKEKSRIFTFREKKQTKNYPKATILYVKYVCLLKEPTELEQVNSTNRVVGRYFV